MGSTKYVIISCMNRPLGSSKVRTIRERFKVSVLTVWLQHSLAFPNGMRPHQREVVSCPAPRPVEGGGLVGHEGGAVVCRGGHGGGTAVPLGIHLAGGIQIWLG